MKLGDILNIKHGYAFDGEHIIAEDNNIVLVTPGNFKIGGGFQEEKCKFFNGDIPQEYVLSSGDIIVTMTDLSKNIDTLGYSALVPSSNKRTYLHNQRIGLVSFQDDSVIPKYIYYLIQTHIYQRAIANTSTGSTVHHTSPSKICDYDIELPSKEIQQTIANVLSAYDDLIENNQKQIKLLEEAAQRLYKEWFVDLHFPGYENTLVIDGLPQGWRKSQIGQEFLTVLGGPPSRAKANYWNGNIPWINSGEINNLRIIKESEFITEEGLKKSSTKIMPKHTTVLAITGATLGQVSYTEIETCANQSVVGIIDNSELFSAYLYLYVANNIWEMIGKATGGAQQHINKDIVNDYPVIIPSNNVISKSNDIVEPSFEKIATLFRQNINLTQARDRLLPKLMNGEMEV